MKKFFRRKAYTLVELVLALALTALISSITGTFITYAVRMRSMADAETDMYMTSLRLHKAIDAELSSSGEVYLYAKGPTSYTKVLETDRVLYLKNGMLYFGNKKATTATSSTSILPIANGFDSYNGVTLDSITYKVVKSMDYMDADTSEPTDVYRAVQVTTVVSKGSWSYTHTSTIRFDEMILTGSQVRISTTDTAYNKDSTRLPIFSDESKEYAIIMYSTN